MRWRRLLVPTLGFIALAIFSLLYCYDTGWYFRILTVAFAYPYQTPFVDSQFLLSTLECWRHGVDVYKTNSCDVMGRTFNYSPLWLRFGFLPDDISWTNWI